MSADTHTNWSRWIAGILVAVVLLILVFFSVIRSSLGRAGEPQVGHRSPVARLAYCSPQDDKLCIVSFSQVEDGAMQVNFQVPHPFFPEFILVIDRYGVESSYECQRAEGLTTRVTCSGAPQVPGEILQFKVISKSRGRLLAEGKFSIIGIALSTLEIIPIPTLGEATGTPTVTPTGTPLRTPTPVRTAPSPSYPNPSYP